MISKMTACYDRTVLAHPILTLLIVLAGAGFLGMNIGNFKLDASSDTLVLEGDEDLRYYNKIRSVYGSDDYLIIPYTPKGDLFSDEAIAGLDSLCSELAALERVARVISVLDVPLFHSPKVPLFQLLAGLSSGNFQSLRSAGVDRDLARLELTQSPLYRDSLISAQGQTTAVLVTFVDDPEFREIRQTRNGLRQKRATGLTSGEAEELDRVNARYSELHTRDLRHQRQDVAAIRAIIDRHRQEADIFLGGVPMIAADMIDYVRNDILVFGAGVTLFLIITLAVVFRRPRWVLLPIVCCLLAVLCLMGFLGLVNWPATVISSNFTSLLLIITMSMAIHVAVRFRELSYEMPTATQGELVLQTVRLVSVPCLYCALTTMVGFGSLVVSGIRPVIDFGLMMTVGIAFAYLLVFLVLPAFLVLMSAGGEPKWSQKGSPVTGLFARMTENHGGLILALSALITLLGLFGIRELKVENRFIDYFKPHTEIARGMGVIDRELGGTTPLELILDADQKGYWLKTANLAQLRRIHEFLAELSETGQVLSFDTVIHVVEGINNGQPINDAMLGMVRLLPEKLKKDLVDPFVSDEFRQARIVMRVRETDPSLMRQVLLGKIHDLMEREGIATERYRLTGMFVLYNNMLQSLFRSQIQTMGLVFLAILSMFVILFRSLKLAFIAMVPNLFPVVLVLGVMGWLGIPLDMMTITVAAITIGIAVDHTIHYVHRFQKEFPKDRDYIGAMHRCHASIGRAMFYTSLTIIVGFSILTFSNFIPTLYFGLFTGLAMLIALLAALMLLPRLLVTLRPLGPAQPDKPIR